MALTLPRNLLRAASASTGSQSLWPAPPQAPLCLRVLRRRPRGPGAARGSRQRAPSPAARTPRGRSSRRPGLAPCARAAGSGRCRARVGARPLPQARPPPPPSPPAQVRPFPPPPPLLPGGAAREVCAGRRAGRGGGTRGRGGGRGGGGGDGGRSPAWEWDLGTGGRGGGCWRPVKTEGQGWMCRWPVLAAGVAAVSCEEEWRRPPGAASPHCPLLRRRLAGDRHRVAGFPWASWTLQPDVRPPPLSLWALVAEFHV